MLTGNSIGFLLTFKVKKKSKMINAFLKRFEDPERPLLGPNYWFLTTIGLIAPKSKAEKYIKIFLSELLSMFVVSEFIELYFIRTDIGEVLKNLQISMVCTVIAAKTNTFLMWQNSWKTIFNYITDADKFERENRDEVRGKIIDNYTAYCRKVTCFIWCLIFVTFTVLTQAPLMRYLTSSDFRAGLRNGTETFPHMFVAWMPLEKDHSPGCWITFLWHYYVCAHGACCLAAYDSNVIAIMVFFGGKLELIRERCKRIMGSRGKGVSEEQADMDIRQLYHMHVLLTKNFRLFNSLMSPVMFLYVALCSLLLCVSAYQLTSASNAIQKLLMAEFFMCGIAQLFLYCWHSHDVLLRSQNVSLGPYESEWWAASARQRKGLHLLTGQLRITHMFTAGPFTDLTLPTFLTILKGAYSYYTLLRK